MKQRVGVAEVQKFITACVPSCLGMKAGLVTHWTGRQFNAGPHGQMRGNELTPGLMFTPYGCDRQQEHLREISCTRHTQAAGLIPGPSSEASFQERSSYCAYEQLKLFLSKTYILVILA